MIKLFLDDERFPPDDGGNWEIVRSVDEAKTFINHNGFPSFISFDHDLSDELTGYDLVNWIIDTDMDNDGKFIPEDFSFYVHSQNPIGAKNIQEKLSSYLAHKKTEKN